ncbi:hypothetical protein AB0L74_14850 [Streptomyces sp. NPDC052020]|uniref:hypothetical protein n=1 Tax=Streptomyces sp. NPDC052020 TaxID=3155677 RepID=UPI003432480D
MADEQDKWLDRETAERLLRGEPLDPVDPSARERAERLAAALRALAAPCPPPGGQLPGEAAALAAFRAAHADGTAASGTGSGTAPADPAATGGRGARPPRRVRPLRLTLAAVLAAGMVGGVAVAAGTGTLPAPFGGGAPAPAASAPAAATPGRPLVSPSPRDRTWGEPRPDGTPAGPAGLGAARKDAKADTGEEEDGKRGGTEEKESGEETGAASGSGDRSSSDSDSGSGEARGGAGGGQRSVLARACRDLRAGEVLGAAGRRALERAAGGAARVPAYCEDVLAGSGGRDGGAAGKGGNGAAPGAGQGNAGGRNDGGTSDGEGDAAVKKDGNGSGGRGGDTPSADGAARQSAAVRTGPVRAALPAARPADAPRP